MLEHVILGLMLLVEAVVSLIVLLRIFRVSQGSQERLEALMHGQEHIAELVAEVLRRQRP